MNNQVTVSGGGDESGKLIMLAESGIPPLKKILTEPSGLPRFLLGESGENRSTEGSQIRADNDLQAIQSWLNTFKDSPNTLRAYTKEAERFVQWCWFERGMAVSDIKKDEVEAYRDFLKAPGAAWVVEEGAKAVRRTDPRWRPFYGPLSDKSRQQAIRILGNLFSYLNDAGYIRGNPVKLIGKDRVVTQDVHEQTVERYLEEEEVQFLLGRYKTPPDIADETAYGTWIREKTLLSFLLYQAPRCSEVSNTRMNDFVKHRDKWWWNVIGKGNKQALVPLRNEMLQQLAEYRRFLGLSPLPHPEDDTFFIRDSHGQRGVTSLTIYLIVKKMCADTALEIETDLPVSAARLRQASPHWFRHTAITRMVDGGVPMKMAQLIARHSRMETTGIYYHEDKDRLHDVFNQQ